MTITRPAAVAGAFYPHPHFSEVPHPRGEVERLLSPVHWRQSWIASSPAFRRPRGIPPRR